MGILDQPPAIISNVNILSAAKFTKDRRQAFNFYPAGFHFLNLIPFSSDTLLNSVYLSDCFKMYFGVVYIYPEKAWIQCCLCKWKETDVSAEDRSSCCKIPANLSQCTEAQSSKAPTDFSAPSAFAESNFDDIPCDGACVKHGLAFLKLH